MPDEAAAPGRTHEEFVYAVVHDLRAPLRAIAGFAGLYEEEQGAQLDAPARRLLDVIREHTERMNQQLDGLSALSRASGRVLQPQVIDMAALVAAVVEELRSLEPARAVTVTVGALGPASGDADLVREVVSELLANAWKFTAGCAAPAVDVGPCSAEGANCYVVRDNGAGFDGTHADTLFAAFKRLHPRGEFPGVGLGLARVRLIVERHGGRVRAEGTPGGGAAFHFSLPVPREG